MARWWTQTKKHYASVRQWLKEEKSPWAWLVNLAIAFLIIKFIVYPGLGLLFGSSLPVVAVVSSSMDHDAINGVVCGVRAPADYRDDLDGYWSVCGAWYESRGITKETFRLFPLTSGFNKGDIMVLWGRGDVAAGDVIVYVAGQQYPIIHRVWLVNQTHFSTKGDHNPGPIQEYVLVQGGAMYSCEREGKPAPCFLGTQVTSATPGAVALLDETMVARDQLIGRAVFKIPLLGWIKIWFSDLIGFIAGVF